MNKTIGVCLLIWCNCTFAQTTRIDNLIFEGAGIRGVAYCGAIKAMEEKGFLQGVQRIGGTSAGAITALLLSIGYSAKEIETIVGTTDYKKFNDGGFPFFGGLHRLRKKYGWYKGVKFEKWLNQLIKQKTGDENIRFADLSVKFKALYITGTSLNDQKAFLFSAESFPEMKVKDAVRISMSIPLYYQAVWMDDAGILYKKPLKNKVLHVMTDGGFLNNFPIEVFDSTKYRETGTKNSFSINPFTVGCRIDSKPQIALDQHPGNTLLAPIAVNSLGNYMKAFMVLNMERLSRQKLKPEDWQRTISIDDGGIGPKIKKMPAEKISLLVQNGFDATIRFLENKQAQSP